MPTRRCAAAGLALAVLLAGCSGDDGDADRAETTRTTVADSAGTGSDQGSSTTATTESTGAGGDDFTAGPLCELLPAGDEPGGPADLAGQPVTAAIDAIPVLTVFAAALRATGLDAELAAASDGEGVTVLAATDRVFQSMFTVDELDVLLVDQREDLRAVIEAHLVDGVHSLDDLIAAGEVTTRSGDAVTVERGDEGMIRFDGGVETECADYQLAGATLHIVDGLLGDVPEVVTGTTEPHSG